MTVCITAACENGRVVVAATDNATSLNEVTVDNLLPKMIWRGDWLFMYSGEPSNAELLLADINQSGVALNASTMRETVHAAFRRRLSRWSSDAILGPFDMGLAEFREKGCSTFGDGQAAVIANQIEEVAQRFEDRILVVGWGAAEKGIYIHEENKDGSVSHAYVGYAAIGSGASAAMAQLLMLKQARSCSLTDTLYAVATAKFTAESASGVGKHTTLWIGWKRRESDDVNRPAGRFVQLAELDVLRALWEQQGFHPMRFHLYCRF